MAWNRTESATAATMAVIIRYRFLRIASLIGFPSRSSFSQFQIQASAILVNSAISPGEQLEGRSRPLPYPIIRSVRSFCFKQSSCQRQGMPILELAQLSLTSLNSGDCLKWYRRTRHSATLCSTEIGIAWTECVRTLAVQGACLLWHSHGGIIA